MQTTKSDHEVLILGGGPAGLATGWAFEELKRPYCIFEGAPIHGGNSRTLRHGEFRFDTGPHRFHDRDPEVTKRVVQLLGPDLHEVGAPSHIYWNGRVVDFPLKPLQVLTCGGLRTSVVGLMDFARARFNHNGAPPQDFASWATSCFGRSVANAFLIPFSEKLWGLPATDLSPDIAGRRLPAFTLTRLMKDALSGTQRPSHHEGRFLYPRYGYGQIVDAIAAVLEPERLQCACRVTRVHCEHGRIVAVDVDSKGTTRTRVPSAVVNTLPITVFVHMMDPPPPSEVLHAARLLRFRDMVLVAVFLDQPSVSAAACLYFPDPKLGFTRAHEPRNRSAAMSPEGKTSLVIELPCFEGDEIWNQDDARLTTYVAERLAELRVIEPSRIQGSTVTRLKKAYPVYSKDYASLFEIVMRHLQGYENLDSVGRGGAFSYGGGVADFIASGFVVARAVHTSLGE